MQTTHTSECPPTCRSSAHLPTCPPAAGAAAIEQHRNSSEVTQTSAAAPAQCAAATGHTFAAEAAVDAELAQLRHGLEAVRLPVCCVGMRRAWQVGYMCACAVLCACRVLWASVQCLVW